MPRLFGWLKLPRFQFYDFYAVLIVNLDQYEDSHNKKMYKITVVYTSAVNGSKRYTNSSHAELNVSKENWVREIFEKFPLHSYNRPKWGKDPVTYYVYDYEKTLGLNTDPIKALTQKLDNAYLEKHNFKIKIP